MDSREERLARNESIFREVNERVREIAVEHGTDGHIYAFYCECSNPDCTLRLNLTVAEYEMVRSEGHRFLIAPGHNLPEIERVIMRTENWWVIAKEGEAGELADELDPRS